MRPTLLSKSVRSSLRSSRVRGTWICPSCRHSSSTASSRPDPQPPTTLPPSRVARKPFYITTPIFYVNAAPHVGHMYTMVLADVIKRYQALRGKDAILCTGTDEHGMKVQQAAEKAHTSPQPFCDKGAEIFKTLASRCGISNEHFIRTTDPEHKEAVQYAWQILKDKGLIYTSKHEGWYCVSDETFYPKSAVHLIVDPATGRKHMASMETGKEVEWVEEPNYHFRLSAFRDRLLDFYEMNPGWIIPASRRDDVYNHIKEGLQDLSISRPSSRLTWGIPVPDDPSQTIYVWLDALINYVTKAGYPWPPDKAFAGGWPADVQVIGKDIMRFHCIYWPAFLMALDIPLPLRILTHAHWTLGKQKMAKSTGNVVNPFFALDRFGVDVMRFYLMHDGGMIDDADYSNSHVISRYKHCLHGQLGNLASRVTRGKSWNVSKSVRDVEHEAWLAKGPEYKADCIHWKALNLVEHEVSLEMEKFKVGAALETIMNLIYKTNQYITHQGPWYMTRDENKTITDPRLNTVIYLCAESLRIVGILLQPYMPDKAALLLDMLGVDKARRGLEYTRVGTDFTYGTPKVDLGKGPKGVLFPPLLSEV